jgi:hypothetical protein
MSVDEYIEFHMNWRKAKSQDDIIGKLIKRKIRFEEGDRFTDANAVIDTTKEKWHYDGCLVRWNKKREID